MSIESSAKLNIIIKNFRKNALPEPISLPTDIDDVVIEKPSADSPFNDVYQFYKDHQAVFWTEDEIDMSLDKQHYKLLNSDEKHFLSCVLGFFAGSDVIVCKNIEENYITQITNPYVILFYDFQKAMENTHSLTYSNMLRALLDREEYEHVKKAVISMPIVKKKADWARKWINADCTLAELLVAFKCVEGIFFAGSFCAIYWLGEIQKEDKTGLFPGLGIANEFIARDEGIHTAFADVLYNNHIVNKLPYEIVREIFMDAVAIEKEFVLDALPCKLIGMNAELMSYYIEYVANHEISKLGYSEVSQLLFPRRPCPFPFMTKISLQKKSNFFERAPAEYSKAGSYNVNELDGTFGIDADF